jgi:hypothetical protein
LAFAHTDGGTRRSKTSTAKAAAPGDVPSPGKGLLAALARHALAASHQGAEGALPSAAGRLAGLALQQACDTLRKGAARRTRPGVRHGAPLPLPTLVAPLTAWSRAIDDESAAERARWLRCACPDRDTAYANVIEACARALGDEFVDDLCTDFDVTLGLIRLQSLVRCVGAASAGVPRFVPWRVRVAAAPLEPHALGMAIASESFRAAGWEVDETPCTSDAVIRTTLRRAPCDALVLALSDAHRRGDRIPALARSVGQARAANPGLLVYVIGRAFNEGIAQAIDVGADASCSSAVDVPALAARQIRARDAVPA